MKQTHSTRATQKFQSVDEFTDYCDTCKMTTVHISVEATHDTSSYSYCDEHTDD